MIAVRALRIAAAVAGLGLTLLVACNGGSGGDVTPTSEPSAVIPVPGKGTATPQPPVEPTSYRLLYSEFGSEADVIWSIPPSDPTDRVKVASVSHKAGWAIKSALSPDGGKIAYNAMPEAGTNASTDAETFLLDLKSDETTKVAGGVDLLTRPVWSPDGKLVFLRRNVDEDVTVILVDVSKLVKEEGGVPSAETPGAELTPTRTVLRQHISDVLSFIPVGVDEGSAAMLFIQIQGGTESGTFLGQYVPATFGAVSTATAVVGATATALAATPTTPGPTPTVAGSPTPRPALAGSRYLFLSDQTAFGFALSPDSSRLAFLVPGLVEGEFVFQTHVAEIKTDQITDLSGEGLPPGEQLGPAWHPDGDKIAVGQLPAGGDPGRVAIVPLDGGKVTFLPPPEVGYDEPLSWSPDGKFLAVISFQGESLGNPGPPRLVFASPNGQRPAAPQGTEFDFIGWLAAE